MTEVIALVLERVESFVFYPQTGATAPHDLHDIVSSDLKVGHPTEAVEDGHPFAFGHNLPVLKEVHPQFVLTGLIEWHGVDEAKAGKFLFVFGIGQNEFRRFATLGAYSVSSRPPIPVESGHRFRWKSATLLRE